VEGTRPPERRHQGRLMGANGGQRRRRQISVNSADLLLLLFGLARNETTARWRRPSKPPQRTLVGSSRRSLIISEAPFVSPTSLSSRNLIAAGLTRRRRRRRRN
jgi:hypothetical protein